MSVHLCACVPVRWYGVALVSRIDKITGLFCKRALKKSLYSAKETYDFKEPTNRSHPMMESLHHGVATISRLLKIVGLF